MVGDHNRPAGLYGHDTKSPSLVSTFALPISKAYVHSIETYLCCMISSLRSGRAPPFAVRHQRFRIRSRSRVRLPVKFNQVCVCCGCGSIWRLLRKPILLVLVCVCARARARRHHRRPCNQIKSPPPPSESSESSNRPLTFDCAINFCADAAISTPLAPFFVHHS